MARPTLDRLVAAIAGYGFAVTLTPIENMKAVAPKVTAAPLTLAQRVEATPAAPYGLKKDGTPKARPGRPKGSKNKATAAPAPAPVAAPAAPVAAPAAPVAAQAVSIDLSDLGLAAPMAAPAAPVVAPVVAPAPSAQDEIDSLFADLA